MPMILRFFGCGGYRVTQTEIARAMLGDAVLFALPICTAHASARPDPPAQRPTRGSDRKVKHHSWRPGSYFRNPSAFFCTSLDYFCTCVDFPTISYNDRVNENYGKSSNNSNARKESSRYTMNRSSNVYNCDDPNLQLLRKELQKHAFCHPGSPSPSSRTKDIQARVANLIVVDSSPLALRPYRGYQFLEVLVSTKKKKEATPVAFGGTRISTTGSGCESKNTA